MLIDPSSVILGPIKMPCSGTVRSSGESFDDSCPRGGSNMFRWMDFAADYARGKGITVEDFQHWVMILPVGFGERAPNDPAGPPAWAPSESAARACLHVIVSRVFVEVWCVNGGGSHRRNKKPTKTTAQRCWSLACCLLGRGRDVPPLHAVLTRCWFVRHTGHTRVHAYASR